MGCMTEVGAVDVVGGIVVGVVGVVTDVDVEGDGVFSGKPSTINSSRLW